MQMQTQKGLPSSFKKRAKPVQGNKRYDRDCTCNENNTVCAEHNVFVQLIISCREHETFEIEETFRNMFCIFIKLLIFPSSIGSVNHFVYSLNTFNFRYIYVYFCKHDIHFINTDI